MIDLMKPRYEVIADYFFSPYKIGDVVTANERDTVHLLNVPEYDSFEGKTIECQHFLPVDVCKRYPALYKELQWWQHRKAEEMPEYVKYVKSGEVRELSQDGWTDMFHLIEHSDRLRPSLVETLGMIEPATKSDYEAYLKTK